MLFAHGDDMRRLRPPRCQHNVPASKEEFAKLTTLDQMDPANASVIREWTPRCQELGGKLGWVAEFTRPDIRLALSLCMQHVAGSNEGIFKALLGILAYLENTKALRLRYGHKLERPIRNHVIRHVRQLHVDPYAFFDLVAFCDASYDQPKPMMCIIVCAGGAPVAWRVMRMPVTPLSTCEAEWFGATLLATTLAFLHPVLAFFQVRIQTPLILLCDNESACKLSERDMGIKKLRHVAMRLAYLQEMTESQFMALLHIFTEGELADIGTKILESKQTILLRNLMLR